MHKIHPIILLLLLLSFGNCFAQPEAKNSKDSINKIFKTAVEEYKKGKYIDAIESWKIVLKKLSTNKDELLRVKTITNIGASYNAIGYHKSALNYFIKTDKLLKNTNPKKENYWINYLNIGVCYMSLEQYDLAKSYLDSTENLNDHIEFLKNLNLAKWYADQGDKKTFFKYKDAIDKTISKFEIYQDPWEEMQFDFFREWNDISNLKALLTRQETDYNELNISLKLNFNTACLIVYGKLHEPIEKLLSYAKEVKEEKNYYLNQEYYNILKNYYLKQNNTAKYAYYSDLSATNTKAMYVEKNMMYVEDFKTAQILQEFKTKYVAAQLKNKLISSQLQKSDLKFYLTISVLGLSILLILLLIKNYIVSKRMNHLITMESIKELKKKDFDKIELSEHLKLTSEELNNSMVNIKKIMLLKKQLENILKGTINDSEKETIHQIKITLNSFFANYKELSDLINKKVNVEKIIIRIKEQYTSLTDQEILVIEYIILNFTTKEIALLVNKSDKSVEYYRTQIRKKIGIDHEVSLEHFLSSYS